MLDGLSHGLCISQKITPFPALIIARRAGADNKERESVEEKLESMDEATMREKVLFLYGYYTGRAKAEEDAAFQEFYVGIAQDFAWALGIKEEGEKENE